MRTHRGATRNAAVRQTLVVFAVGGHRLATPIEEVGGVWPWHEPTLVPSRTPYVDAVLPHDGEFLPVFNLAGFLDIHVTGQAPFCLVLKTQKGPMAVCVDDVVPSMYVCDSDSIQPTDETEPYQTGTCRIAGEPIPIYSFKKLGTT